VTAASGAAAVLDALASHDQATAVEVARLAEQERRLELARTVGTDLRAQLAELAEVKSLRAETAIAIGQGALDRVLAALAGETRPEALRFQGIIPLRPTRGGVA
jgi:hypothetical protein